jgi:phenylalanyl-tRNA synthetase alpha chain
VSGPNTSFDPKQVASLDSRAIATMVDQARIDIAAAVDLAALKEVRLAHAGDRSPLSLANREIGALPPAAKAEVGKRVGEARGEIKGLLDARQAALEIERDEHVLADERVDVTLPTDWAPLGARHPLTTLMEHVADVFIAMGYDIAEGPEAEAACANFD